MFLSITVTKFIPATGTDSGAKLMGDMRRIAVVVLLVGLHMAVLCGGPSQVHGEESGIITGTWVANGRATNMVLGEERTASLVQLAGHVNLKEPVIGSTDFWGKCIGLADSETGGDVRCVWRSLDGFEIYLLLDTEPLEEGNRVTGEIIGGSEKAKGITGTIEFVWSSLIFQSMDNITTIGGYAREMSGSYVLPAQEQ